jgi:D-sedoheptulose 7-phosphate isomerase
MQKYIRNALLESQSALDLLIGNDEAIAQLDQAATALVECFQAGGKVISCGNGGSMCDAMHFAEELSGKFRLDRKPLAAVSISDPSHISCTGNDYGYDFVFSRYVEAHASKGDILLGISTSGTSKNVIKAAQAAKEAGAKVIVLSGKKDCSLGELANWHIATESGSAYADRVQELHIKCIHILIELVERKMFSMTYE